MNLDAHFLTILVYNLALDNGVTDSFATHCHILLCERKLSSTAQVLTKDTHKHSTVKAVSLSWCIIRARHECPWPIILLLLLILVLVLKISFQGSQVGHS